MFYRGIQKGRVGAALLFFPGGYRFGDCWCMGLPLEVIVIVVSISMILWGWLF